MLSSYFRLSIAVCCFSFHGRFVTILFDGFAPYHSLLRQRYSLAAERGMCGRIAPGGWLGLLERFLFLLVGEILITKYSNIRGNPNGQFRIRKFGLRTRFPVISTTHPAGLETVVRLVFSKEPLQETRFSCSCPKLRERLTEIRLLWDAEASAISNHPGANQFLRRDSREGWWKA